MGPPCQRLRMIEARLAAPDYGAQDADDARWMLGQIRGWQAFGKRVVDFGGLIDRLRIAKTDSSALSASVISDAIAGYEAVFHGDREGSRPV